MPTTGRIYDLESNWWVEERHDPVLSTRAAVKYLDYLYNRFNQDLILTLIAYHAGPTFLERRINGLKKSGKKITFNFMGCHPIDCNVYSEYEWYFFC